MAEINNGGRPKIAIALNTTWNLVNFRAGLIRALDRAGYDVVALSPADGYESRLAALGCRHVPLPMDGQGTHPIDDARLLASFWRILRREQPAVFLGYTVKPNIYGSLAAQALGIPVINNIAGLGAVFINHSRLTILVSQMYRLSLRRSSRVFFQNRDDLALFLDRGLVRPAQAGLLPGSGVDLGHFTVTPMPRGQAGPGRALGRRFLLVARMLWDKGVGEYVEAARWLRLTDPGIECCLLGFLDVENPAAIPRAQMDAWVAEGVVRYLGTTDDVRPFIASADCVVLPSYREGTPRTLLEAAAMGRPIITTDATGCRDVVDDGVNGFLCRPRDAADLAEKMAAFCRLSAEQRAEMGGHGREKMQREFDERIVVRRYLEVVNALVPAPPSPAIPG